jgi:Domain of unknown function (DUF4124)
VCLTHSFVNGLKGSGRQQTGCVTPRGAGEPGSGFPRSGVAGALWLMLYLSTVPTASSADVYVCTDVNGNLLYTNVTSQVKGCKFLNVLPPTFPHSVQLGMSAAAAAVVKPAAAQPVQRSATRDVSEPGARLQALEDWARGSRATLDPVTHALVDPDESVRARAQQLWEETLEGR